MKSAKILWQWLDGNKTVFGTLMLGVAPYIPYPSLQQILTILGAALGGVGMAHKIIKGRANTGKEKYE